MFPPTVSSLGERALIDRITARLASAPWVIVGPGDDAAVIEPERGTLDVLTTDALVEGVHFDRAFMTPVAIGHRALAVNLSDLAAMGSRPRVALLSLVMPDDLPVEVLDGIIEGMTALAVRQAVAIVGGNIARTSGPLVIDVTAVGSVGRRRLLQRSGSRPGDHVYVTGSIGDAVAGLGMLREGIQGGQCVERFLRPEPRVRAGRALAGNRVATSCVDLSDGLADGVTRLAAAAGLGIALDGNAIPISDDARRWLARHGDRALDAAITGGDDYELLFTARPTIGRKFQAVRKALGDLPITRIGVVTSEPRLTIDGRDLPAGFEHFR